MWEMEPCYHKHDKPQAACRDEVNPDGSAPPKLEPTPPSTPPKRRYGHSSSGEISDGLGLIGFRVPCTLSASASFPEVQKYRTKEPLEDVSISDLRGHKGHNLEATAARTDLQFALVLLKVGARR